jgi:hypothetical protein
MVPQALMERIHAALKQNRRCEGSPHAFLGANATGVHFFGYFLCASKDKITGSDFEFANANPKGERQGGCS